MQLISVLVDGFRNVCSSKLILDDILSVVSLNSYGKSNLLHSIDFGVDFIKAPNRVKERMMRWTRGIPLNKKNANSDFSIELEFLTQHLGRVHRVQYGYAFRWLRNDDSGERILREYLRMKLDEKGSRYSLLLKRKNDEAYYKSSVKGRCDSRIRIESSGLVVNKLQAFDDLYYRDVLRELNEISVYVDRHFDTQSSYKPDPVMTKGIDDLSFESTEHLPRTIYYLKKMHPNQYALLMDAYRQLFPQFEHIRVLEADVKGKLGKMDMKELPFTISDKIYSLYVEDKNLNQPISFEALSDGAQRVFLLLSNLILAELNHLNLIAIEEPENSVHPALFQRYLQILASLAGDVRIVMTSHSPYILQYQRPENIYIGLPNADGIAQFQRIRPSAQKTLLAAAAEEDMSLGDYVFELLSNPADESNILASYMEPVS